MGTGTLTNRATGEVILQGFFNDIHGALNGDFVGRNSSGVPTSGQNLGTASLPWGTIRSTGLVVNGASVDVSQATAPSNRVVSGKTRSTSNQPAFLTPAGGSTLTVTVAGATTNLVLDINGATVSVTSDVAKTSLTAAPSSNNTCLVDEALAADQADTRVWGERNHYRDGITVDTMGSEITALVGTWQSFSINNGSATEYFFAYVESTTKLSKIMRGYFYDSSLNPVNRVAFANNDTITLMKTGWVFVENNGTTVDVSYTSPVYGKESPASPVTGDYWYDTDNNLWKRYDGASFVSISRTLVGMIVNDSSGCKAARCQPFYYKADQLNTMDLEIESTSIVRSRTGLQYVVVAGNLIKIGGSFFKWNITADLAGATDMYDATEQASRMYYLYLTDEGDTKISDIQPYADYIYGGKYHPHNPWRCVGLAYNNASSNIVQLSAQSNPNVRIRLEDGNGHGSSDDKLRRYTTTTRNIGANIIYTEAAATGARFDCFEEGKYFVANSDYGAGAVAFGFSRNTTEGTTGIAAIADASREGISSTPAGQPGMCSATLNLKVGEYFHSHTDGSPNATDANSAISVTQVG